jgi:hypothetical protein
MYRSPPDLDLMVKYAVIGAIRTVLAVLGASAAILYGLYLGAEALFS